MIRDRDRFAGYVIERELGSGRSSTVYLARHAMLPRTVALKVMNDDVSSDPARRTRFEQAVAGVAGLELPGVVGIVDTGVEPADDPTGTPWLAMDYVAGPTLADLYASRGGRLAPDEALRIARPIAHTLDDLHRRGLVHGAVRPRNILLSDADGRVLLTDVGIESGDDERSAGDVYGLAAILFALLTGSAPTVGATASSINPALPAAVDAVLARGLAADPAARPRSATELVDGLAAAFGSGGVVTPVVSPAAPPRKGLWIGLAAAVVVVLVAVGVGGYFLFRDSADEPCDSVADAAAHAMETVLTVDGHPRADRVREVVTPRAWDRTFRAAIENTDDLLGDRRILATVNRDDVDVESCGSAAKLVVPVHSTSGPLGDAADSHDSVVRVTMLYDDRWLLDEVEVTEFGSPTPSAPR